MQLVKECSNININRCVKDFRNPKYNMGRRKMFGPALPPAMAKARRAARRAAVPRKAATVQLIKKVISGVAETKQVSWYSGASLTGAAASAQAVAQNQNIVSNTTDLLRILPLCFQGVGDNQRIGQNITPKSLKVHCKVGIIPQGTSGTGYQNGYSYNLVCVAYCLQHVSYKTYGSLLATNGNVFSQLLSTGESSTTGFNGLYSQSKMPIEKAYYRLLGKKVFRLRSSGTQAAGVPTPNYEGSNNNAAPMIHEWTWDLTKHLPKKIVYPEETPGSPVSDPANTAPFWCVGYYNASGLPYTTPVSAINQEYVSHLQFKDL